TRSKRDWSSDVCSSDLLHTPSASVTRRTSPSPGRRGGTDVPWCARVAGDIDFGARRTPSGLPVLVVAAHCCIVTACEESFLVTVRRRPFVQLPVRGAELHHGTDRAGDRLRRRRRPR